MRICSRVPFDGEEKEQIRIEENLKTGQMEQVDWVGRWKFLASWLVAAVLGAMLMGTVQHCSAALMTFNFSGTSRGLNSPWNTGTSIDTKATTPSSGFELGSGLAGNTANNWFKARSWSSGNTLASALSGNDCFGFSIMPRAGYG